MKSNSQSIQYYMMKLKKKLIKKEPKKRLELTYKTCNPGYKIAITP